MTYEYDFLEWEVTTACNAACPQCPRNYYGGKTWNTLPIVQNSLAWAQQHLPVDFIRKLSRVDFCGTYGDPIMNNQLQEIIAWLFEQHPDLHISIKTNGGLRDPSWWTNLGILLGNRGSVFFGIDGLADTNHLYRRRVDFDTVINNAQAFIHAGGQAHWSYIVFRHNQHQVDRARELANQFGFQEFNVKLTSRFFNKSHEMVDSLTVYNEKGLAEYQLQMPTLPEYVNESYDHIRQIKSKTALDQHWSTCDIKCKNKARKRLYLSAEGYVFPCGWLHDRMYGYEVEQTKDREELENLFTQAGGRQMANIEHTAIEDIINGVWFETLQNSWTNSHRLNRCGAMCGTDINLIDNQNRLVKAF